MKINRKFHRNNFSWQSNIFAAIVICKHCPSILCDEPNFIHKMCVFRQNSIFSDVLFMLILKFPLGPILQLSY